VTIRDDFRSAYAGELKTYLRDGGEPGLEAAYQFGRDAVAAGFGVIDLAEIHHEALACALRDAADVETVAVAAGDFFGESLSAFEMVQRGFREARDAAVAEKRQAAMLRRLSAFLADASLALEGPDALAEVLQLVAENARELAGAGWCLASLTSVEVSGPLVALAAADPEDAGGIDASCLLKLAPPPGAPVSRSGAAELITDPAAIALARLVGLDRPLGGRLAVRLATLDGRELGCIQRFDKEGGGFSEVDEATVVHLAQTAAATVERLRLYARASGAG
jgi:hypothetical protein